MNIKAAIRKIIHNDKFSIFSLIFFVLLLSFGLMIPFLGFYWDDWETILIAHQYPLNQFWDYFSGPRPLAAWTYFLFTPFIGSSTILWHITTLVLRGMTAVGFWWVFSLIWPERKNEISWATLLFVIYPNFRQQAIAVSYHQHWLAFALYFFSVAFMLKGISEKSRKWLWITLSVIFQFGHMSILEYFWGLELLRPILAWIYCANGEKSLPIERIKKSLISWLPNLLLLIAFYIWRMQIIKTNNINVNAPVLLINFFANPLDSISRFVSHMLQDVMYMLFGSWFDTLSPDIAANFPTSFQLMQIFIFCVLFLGVYFLLSKQSHPDEKNENNSWWSLLFVGIVALILGGIQIWITDRQAYTTSNLLYVDRFLLPAMPAAALLFVYLINSIGKNFKTKILIVTLLIAIAGTLHIRIGNSYRWSWTDQERVYWQLYWRAPWVEADVNYISDQLLFNYVRPTFSFHVLYNQPESADEHLGRFFLAKDLAGYEEDDMLSGIQIDTSHRNFTFSSLTTDNLLLYYHPDEDNNCVWLLNRDDYDHPMISDELRDLLDLININKIERSHDLYSGPDPVIFGQEPEHNWCYFYQKAELARQFEEWDEILQLSDEAANAGYDTSNSQSNSPYEWIPFIQAYMKTGNWKMASDTLVSTYRTNTDYRAMLCRVWNQNAAGVEEQTSFTESDEQVNEVLECNSLYE